MFYTANGTALTKKSKGFKLLKYIAENKGATKYECITNTLCKNGTKHDLRGYYSSYFHGLTINGVLSYNKSTHKYNITDHGAVIFVEAMGR